MDDSKKILQNKKSQKTKFQAFYPGFSSFFPSFALARDGPG